MRRPGGYAIIVDPLAPTVEYDTFSCAHGNEIVPVVPGRPPEESGGWCRMCDKPLCAKCAATGRCEPFEKKIEAVERRDRLMRALTG